MNFGHGGNVEEISRKYNIKEQEIIDFSANINPYGISPKVKDAMIRAIDKIQRYPDITYYKLKKSIASYENTAKDNIILGNGAAEVIFNIVRGLKPRKALIQAPTFSEYEDALKSIGCKVKHYIMEEDFTTNEGFIEAIDKEIDIVFLCNPNNPTGILVDRQIIKKLLDKCREKKTVLVIDESFMDFIEKKTNYSAIRYIDEYENLIVVKSLTKFFAYPGIRIGYGLTSNDKYKDKINNISVPWSINTVAVEGAIYSLIDESYIQNTIDYVKKENDFLYEELKKFQSLSVYKGWANFLFFKLNIKIDLKEELIKKGILIRSCNNYIGLKDGYYRVAVRTREENLKLIKVLKNIID